MEKEFKQTEGISYPEDKKFNLSKEREKLRKIMIMALTRSGCSLKYIENSMDKLFKEIEKSFHQREIELAGEVEKAISGLKDLI